MVAILSLFTSVIKSVSFVKSIGRYLMRASEAVKLLRVRSSRLIFISATLRIFLRVESSDTIAESRFISRVVSVALTVMAA